MDIMHIYLCLYVYTYVYMFIYTYFHIYIYYSYKLYVIYTHIYMSLDTARPSRMAVGTKLYHPNAFITTDVSETEFVKI